MDGDKSLETIGKPTEMNGFVNVNTKSVRSWVVMEETQIKAPESAVWLEIRLPLQTMR